MNKIIVEEAINEARKNMNEGYGGPFGTVIIKDDKLVAVASNSVLKDHDPTAHGEVNAIRKACKVLGTHDLTGCKLYTTAYPCPMCLGAIMWSNIKDVYYGCTAQDTENIGFRDDFMYDFIHNNMQDENVLKLTEYGREDCLNLFNEYQSKDRTLY